MNSDVSERLAAAADAETALRAGIRCMRGIRGVPTGEVARICAEAWRSSPPRLPDDAGGLDRLFGAAWEDGLVAIGLLSTAVQEDPASGLALGLDWAERTDDVTTADALGWLVLAPAALLAGGVDEVLAHLGGHRRTETRRAAAAMGLGFLPEPVEGPAAAALREKVGERHLRLVDQVLAGPLGRVCDRFVRDEDPALRKVLRRVLRAWAASDPRGVVRWADSVPGGLPKLLAAEVAPARRAGRVQTTPSEGE